MTRPLTLSLVQRTLRGAKEVRGRLRDLVARRRKEIGEKLRKVVGEERLMKLIRGEYGSMTGLRVRKRIATAVVAWTGRDAIDAAGVGGKGNLEFANTNVSVLEQSCRKELESGAYNVSCVSSKINSDEVDWMAPPSYLALVSKKRLFKEIKEFYESFQEHVSCLDHMEVLSSRFYTTPRTASWIQYVPFDNLAFSLFSYSYQAAAEVEAPSLPGLTESSLASIEKIKYSLLEREKSASPILAQLCSSPNETSLRIMTYFLTCAFDLIFSRFVVHGLTVIDELVELQESVSIVLVPTHRSHLDYLLLSYVCFCCGLKLPHIAAGDNLNLPIVGEFLRQCGAFFIRRSFKSDQLYKNTISNWVSSLVEEGHSLEFFIEGTRSRNGRIKPPKFGILNYILNGKELESSKKRDIMFVPISFGYDYVFESATYAKESIGHTKTRESIFELIKSAYSLLSSVNSKGDVHVSFGLPVLIKHGENVRSVSSLANNIIKNIICTIPLTMASLFSFVLFAASRWNIRSKRYPLIRKSILIRMVQQSFQAFSHFGCNFTFAFEEISHEVNRVFILFSQKGLCRVDKQNSYLSVLSSSLVAATRFFFPFYSTLADHLFSPSANDLDEEIALPSLMLQKIELNYSRNALVQSLFFPSIICTAILQLSKKADVLIEADVVTNALHLACLFEIEFPFFETDLQSQIRNALNFSLEAGFLQQRTCELIICDEAPLKYLAEVLGPLLDSYSALLCSSISFITLFPSETFSEKCATHILQCLSVAWYSVWDCVTRENGSIDFITGFLSLLVKKQLLNRFPGHENCPNMYSVRESDSSVWLDVFCPLLLSSRVLLDLKSIETRNSTSLLRITPLLCLFE